MKPINFIRADTCPHCGAERSVEAKTNYGNSIDLSYHIDTGDTNLRNKFIYNLHCKKCGKYFFPIWIGNIPYPSIQRDEDRFLDNYKKYKDVDP